MSLHHPDVVTHIMSERKDRQYISWLRSVIEENVRNVFGIGAFSRHSRLIDALGKFVFYVLTTGANLQTLGEEYTNLVQVDGSYKRTPSLIRRLIFIILHVVLPYLVDKVLIIAEQKLQGTFQLKDNENARIQESISHLKKLFKIFLRIHLSFFYIDGIYYNLSKQVAGIKYVSYSRKEPHYLEYFKSLGHLTLAQSLMATAYLLFIWYKKYNSAIYSTNSSKPSVSNTEIRGSMKCLLCLESCHVATASVCGHLFCWDCICSWLNTKAECPLCREKLTVKNLVTLKN